MVKDELYRAFLEFLSSKDIKVSEDNRSDLALSESVKEEDILSYLYLISEFHKKTMGYKGYMGLRLDNKTGTTVEQYKVGIKRLKRYLKNIRLNSASSNFERRLLKIGFDYIQRAESCIRGIMDLGYMDILERSMKRTEICLGNTSINNLNKVGSTIFVNNLNKCSYNNVEMDCFYILSKCRRRNLRLNYTQLVNKYCEYESLDERSSKFILALLSYPYEFMRCCNRYREKLKEWSEEEYEERLEKAILKDGEVLL